ncbi:MAG TPA: hypothetical protein VFZ34_14310 [Blastocatellia bacterium]|nr:hypothetical protein [Blastocatellia bacterium]
MVNWPQEVQCRRCGTALGAPQEPTVSPLRSRVQVAELQFSDAEDEAFAEANAMIKKGVNAGMLYGGISLLVILVLQAFTSFDDGFLKFAWFDIVLIYGLTFGIHLKNRICAGLMLVYYLLSKLAMLTQGGIGLLGIFVAIAFVKAFYQGWQGTLLYHQVKQSRSSQLNA